MLYSSFTTSFYLISMRGEANGLVAGGQRMSFVEGSALLRGGAVSMDNWVPKFRGSMMFPSSKGRKALATSASLRKKKKEPSVAPLRKSEHLHCILMPVWQVWWPRNWVIAGKH
jgi:hypothetical protein